MKKQIYFIILSLFLFSAACKQEGFKTTETGLKYMFHTDQKDVHPAMGDIVQVHLVYYDENDSLLFDSKQMRDTFLLSVEKPTFRGSIEEGLIMMGAGDSMTMLVSADSVYEKTMKQPLPESVRKGSDLRFVIKMISWRTMDEYNNDMQAKEQKQIAGEQKALENYLTTNAPGVEPTESGLYYIEVEKGSGIFAGIGDEVSVDYTGTFLDGTVFDSSVDKDQKAEFKVGEGMVIPAWDEALQKMQKGTKAKIIVPSYLAYGARGYPGLIPPHKSLVFEMTILDLR